MRSALFQNFTDQEFVGYWDGKPKKFAPGQSLYMPDYLARHFAKHLVNRELLRTDANGTLLHRNGDKMTSPKFPDQVPLFMELFNKAYTPDKDEEEIVQKKDGLDESIDAMNKNKKVENLEAKTGKGGVPDPTKPQVIVPPDFDDDEEFETKPKE